ncbi:hypothetical protein J6590_084486, partial [Homalodisca vitripennis]
ELRGLKVFTISPKKSENSAHIATTETECSSKQYIMSDSILNEPKTIPMIVYF